MPIALAPVWVSKLESLGGDATPAWSKNMADAIGSLTSGKLELIAAYPGAKFTFSTSTFKSELEKIKPGTGPGGKKFASAWANAISASTMVPPVPIGPAFLPPFSVIASATIDAASVTAAKATLASSIDSNPPGPGAMKAFASAFRTAFASVSYTLAGTTIPSPATAPVTVPGVGVM